MLRPPAAALNAFEDAFRHDATLAADAGGRVNLIGEHVDYHDGLVLPFAISLRTWAIVRPTATGVLRMASRHFPEDPLTFEAAALAGPVPALQSAWHRYALGPLWVLAQQGVPVSGADVWIDGDLPLGAGLSSSAAIEVSMLTAFLALAGRSASAKEIALMGQRAEREVAGMPCGIMDQLASATGSGDGRALLIDCRSLRVTEVPLRASLVPLVVDSGVRHALAASEYAKRQAECRAALDRLGKKSARDLELQEIFGLDELSYRRLRHVITEIDRVKRAAAALEAGDHKELGALLYASHESLRDDYEVSDKALDGIVDAARKIPGVIGARMTGGGFGGNAIVLADRARADRVRSELGAAYAVTPVSLGSAPTLWRK